jgi:hypothetical protein
VPVTSNPFLRAKAAPLRSSTSRRSAERVSPRTIADFSPGSNALSDGSSLELTTDISSQPGFDSIHFRTASGAEKCRNSSDTIEGIILFRYNNEQAFRYNNRKEMNDSDRLLKPRNRPCVSASPMPS